MIPRSADCSTCTARSSRSYTSVEPFTFRVRHTAHERILTRMDRRLHQSLALRRITQDRIMKRLKEGR
ncbi:MAG: hypothetical protein ABS70_00490 [Nitrospira sp. SCN 59-13]|nr:MAG: hypothetical protein ABS70_00490 [Nitrospira sp. SCN 59-13]